MGCIPSDLSTRFYERSEPYAGGFFECLDRSRFFRFARAQRRFWERMTLPAYDCGMLYPSGPKYPSPPAVTPDYSDTIHADRTLISAFRGPEIDALEAELDLLKKPEPPHIVAAAALRTP